jgi:hypothetical protein
LVAGEQGKLDSTKTIDIDVCGTGQARAGFAARGLKWSPPRSLGAGFRPDVAFEKAARALAPGGRLAIFGHIPRWSPEIVEAMATVALPKEIIGGC